MASRHDGSGDSSFFSGILGPLMEKKQHVAEEDVDEQGKQSSISTSRSSQMPL
jgi:hypothetical protein